MNAKAIIVTFLLALPAGSMLAQHKGEPARERERAVICNRGDSIVILKGKGDIQVSVHETRNISGGKEEHHHEAFFPGEGDGKRFFADVLPAIPKKKSKNPNSQNSYEPHCSGIYIGFSRLSDNFWNFGASSDAHLDISKSWEFGFNLLCSHYLLSRDAHWGLNFGLNWGYRSFNIDGRRALVKRDECTVFSDGSEHAGTEGYRPDKAYYSRSRLRHFFFQIPVTVEWQKRGDHSFFLNAGPEFEIRHGVKSFSHIQGGGKKRVGKGMYVCPVGVNLLLQAGYAHVGAYLRYSMNRFFQRDKGPELTPYSFGLAWYW